MGSDFKTDDPSFNYPRFFKIILHDTIREGRLAIPKKFVAIYGNCLSNCINLIVPDGTKWEMELSKSGNYEAWLQKGWKEFSEHYSLKHSYMLVFEYQDKSNFHVFIFDTTLLEIEYPRKPNFIPNLELNTSQLNGSTEIEDSDSKNIEFEGKCNESNGSTVSQSLEAAEKFSSANPWFKVVLPSKKGLLQALDIPNKFVLEHTVGCSHTVKLMVEGSKHCWPTKLHVIWKRNRTSFGRGWRAFFTDNSLKYRDVCVFELVATKTLKVHIFRHPSS
ncbi:B3 domain-containing transcription factor VRN1-like isoform X1 [Euphorbia lathyris]|uniref:B3 domain-containing transcription factor VRN1-like isoform X1 n=1 Tax=Euphorbia lathyris TaxID=212925 RepID=UPI00331323B3